MSNDASSSLVSRDHDDDALLELSTSVTANKPQPCVSTTISSSDVYYNTTTTNCDAATNLVDSDGGYRDCTCTMENNDTTTSAQKQFAIDNYDTHDDGLPSNETLLGTAFVTFFSFSTVQFIFAFVAESDAMLGDSMAMMVDAFTYLFNWIAERHKSRYMNSSKDSVIGSTMTPRQLERHIQMSILYLELFPPTLSVTTLMIVTVFVTRKAAQVLYKDWIKHQPVTTIPNINLMIAFSLFNLGLDFVNIFCFAKAKHLCGYSVLPTQDTAAKGNDDAYCCDEMNSSSHNIHINRVNSKDDAVVVGKCSTRAVNGQHKQSSRRVSSESGGSDCSDSSTDSRDSFLVRDSTKHGSSHKALLCSNKHNSTICNEIECSSTSPTQPRYSSHTSASALSYAKLDTGDRTHHDLSSCTITHHDADMHGNHHSSVNRSEPEHNLNMCSAYTHIFADSVRSVAVIVAALTAKIVDGVSPEVADATAAIIVSLLVFLSIFPLLHGMMLTVQKLRVIKAEEKAELSRLQSIDTEEDATSQDSYRIDV